MAAPRTRVLREVEVLARCHTKTAIQTLVRVASEEDYEKVPAAAQVAAANSILDRGWGKPQQHVVFEGENAQQMSDEDLQRHVNDRLLALARSASNAGQAGSEAGGDVAGNAAPPRPGFTPRLVH